ncbi:hypothetical protein FYJ43_07590 [Cutibacterium sp. WCA-380-WT-3A]|uniref:Uncharacterized protein n=1 Tax=Cutibacterium porci TaxID=2605781 RepID=A0A7K0J7G8_9ACTN|nr:hypothetical protein [Cutibacterium porci]MSS45900.1 hypothetical protein [Cutibacterium porci]
MSAVEIASVVAVVGAVFTSLLAYGLVASIRHGRAASKTYVPSSIHRYPLSTDSPSTESVSYTARQIDKMIALHGCQAGFLVTESGLGLFFNPHRLDYDKVTSLVSESLAERLRGRQNTCTGNTDEATRTRASWRTKPVYQVNKRVISLSVAASLGIAIVSFCASLRWRGKSSGRVNPGSPSSDHHTTATRGHHTRLAPVKETSTTGDSPSARNRPTHWIDCSRAKCSALHNVAAEISVDPTDAPTTNHSMRRTLAGKDESR